MNNFSYYIPTRVHFGAGSINKLGTDSLPGKKALIVISSGTSMRKFGYLQKVEELLKQNGVESAVFDKILPNPIKSHVMEGAAMAREEGCDFILGLGGGSSIDAAKSIAMMVNNPGDYWDYVSDGSGKGQSFTKEILPIVAVTTTAGTGTEADPWTVITHEELKEKVGFGVEATFPVLSIVDPEMMLSIPPHLTAYQGFDAFFHATEGYIANIVTPVSDAFALKSIELLYKSLAKAVKNGDDLDARTDVALANTLSGMVESTSSCTSEHSMEHAMSAFYPKLAHGAGLIMLSESYFTYFSKICPERLMDMAKVMGEPGDRSEDFITALKKMQKACGVSALKMSDYGIMEDEIPALAKNAHHAMGGLYEMDRKTLAVEDTIEIMKAAYS
ncbi:MULTISPECIES: iron-containing alcohol dehydrogenase [unclassified Oceanispirochaeta]|uniref:iron-containing alcohol dehydrogenase n=1 Tax=unclassified Oceanispirochaeta TaxID=2635722 RepID=UPI000E0999AE|nr:MULTISPECIES: iron-containing alcohol dehydrogenase [unclassified Oceanispirochaeta]MBF9016356.1 iron-containing alcohol dehydrogenase [Oceanispirochaeta sp. M2]NPD72818.1 iron-containing alcohol dehydrogenase [Oceanispirochaeta sp. M1]RDG31662.1 iron-containing alcohol dehydrogenase [Oceanispirochaeta sp. M1]